MLPKSVSGASTAGLLFQACAMRVLRVRDLHKPLQFVEPPRLGRFLLHLERLHRGAARDWRLTAVARPSPEGPQAFERAVNRAVFLLARRPQIGDQRRQVAVGEIRRGWRVPNDFTKPGDGTAIAAMGHIARDVGVFVEVHAFQQGQKLAMFERNGGIHDTKPLVRNHGTTFFDSSSKFGQVKPAPSKSASCCPGLLAQIRANLQMSTRLSRGGRGASR